MPSPAVVLACHTAATTPCSSRFSITTTTTTTTVTTTCKLGP